MREKDKSKCSAEKDEKPETRIQPFKWSNKEDSPAKAFELIEKEQLRRCSPERSEKAKNEKD